MNIVLSEDEAQAFKVAIRRIIEKDISDIKSSDGIKGGGELRRIIGREINMLKGIALKLSPDIDYLKSLDEFYKY